MQKLTEAILEKKYGIKVNEFYPITDIDQIQGDNDALNYLKYISAGLYLEKLLNANSLRDTFLTLQSKIADAVLTKSKKPVITSADANLQISRYYLLRIIPSWIDTLESLSNQFFEKMFMPEPKGIPMSQMTQFISPFDERPTRTWENDNSCTYNLEQEFRDLFKDEEDNSENLEEDADDSEF